MMEKILCVCLGNISRSPMANKVRSSLGAVSASVMVANEHQGGIPDLYELGLAGYRDCLALLDQVMPNVAQQISGARFASTNGR